MLFFDIGANRGDATLAALQKGYEVIAVEPAPKVYSKLVKNFVYNPKVVPLKYAVSDRYGENIEFYVCEEDGLSTLNQDWLTKEGMPYAGKPYKKIYVTTTTIDALADRWGDPDLIKIDVEGAEWSVLHGMTRRYEKIAFEWTFETLDEHEKQLDYLFNLGYELCGPQYIVNHLEEPEDWFYLQPNNFRQLLTWHQETSDDWIDGGWKKAGLRPTADVGMLWLR